MFPTGYWKNYFLPLRLPFISDHVGVLFTSPDWPGERGLSSTIHWPDSSCGSARSLLLSPTSPSCFAHQLSHPLSLLVRCTEITLSHTLYGEIRILLPKLNHWFSKINSIHRELNSFSFIYMNSMKNLHELLTGHFSQEMQSISKTFTLLNILFYNK